MAADFRKSHWQIEFSKVLKTQFFWWLLPSIEWLHSKKYEGVKQRIFEYNLHIFPCSENVNFLNTSLSDALKLVFWKVKIFHIEGRCRSLLKKSVILRKHKKLCFCFLSLSRAHVVLMWMYKICNVEQSGKFRFSEISHFDKDIYYFQKMQCSQIRLGKNFFMSK